MDFVKIPQVYGNTYTYIKSKILIILLVYIYWAKVISLLNKLFLSNESWISQASYRTMVLTICFQLFKKQTILWR